MRMVRFRVIKGSRLLLGAAVVALALVVCLLALRFFASGDAATTPVGGDLVKSEAQEEEARAALAVLAAPLSGGIEISVVDEDEKADERGQATPAPENEHTDQTVPPLQLDPAGEVDIAASSAPRVLIYHTHTHEAYEQAADDPYVALEAWRTADAQHSVVRVGAELAQLLRERGCEVVHDTTDHELDDLSTAYARSEQTLLSYDEPFDLYIDLHRDAYVEGMGENVLRADGVDYAKLMMLIGEGENFDVKPHFAENYAFACALTDALNAATPGICRDVLVKTNRYNQHVGVYAILVEVGNNRNTLVEALNAMQPLAEAISGILISQEA